MRSLLTWACLGWVVCAGPAWADDSIIEAEARSTAVTLNYCRASFHRLRKTPSKRVLLEEQSRILNNLNINSVADQETITLYAAVLEEVGHERIADKERNVILQTYWQTIRREMISNALIVGSQVGTAQYGAAIRTGCAGWWDYRSLTMSREVDVWKVEKGRMLEVVDKSSKFLDTFWKLAKAKNIPDRWLIRDDDLDRLDAAMAEKNPEVRLRVLQRMERFMECYPPYWYHIGRTQQALGQLFAASETYQKLVELGAGHFRKDDMLASALANRSAIQTYLHQESALETARQALTYSNSEWQANLLAAWVLEQHGAHLEAEEAILRNLDVALERQQSLACLIAHYCNATDITRLAARLNDPAVVPDVPMPVLLRAAAMLGPDQLPAVAQRHIVSSLCGQLQAQFSREQVVIFAKPCWATETAAMSLSCEGLQFPSGKTTHFAANSQHTFAATGDGALALLAADRGVPLQLELKYPDAPVVRLHLQWLCWDGELRVPGDAQAQKHDSRGLKTLFISSGQRRHGTLVQPDKYSFRITEFEFGADRVSLHRGKADPVIPPILAPAAPIVVPPAEAAPPEPKPPMDIEAAATPSAPPADRPKVEPPAESPTEPPSEPVAEQAEEPPSPLP
ncbi:MAG TPA: hypothetical protein VHB77_07885 [Planctomycetaceae bacterium]|nr:hypothetical protein [Planctomycetaceae bacterium]